MGLRVSPSLPLFIRWSFICWLSRAQCLGAEHRDLKAHLCFEACYAAERLVTNRALQAAAERVQRDGLVLFTTVGIDDGADCSEYVRSIVESWVLRNQHQFGGCSAEWGALSVRPSALGALTSWIWCWRGRTKCTA